MSASCTKMHLAHWGYITSLSRKEVPRRSVPQREEGGSHECAYARVSIGHRKAHHNLGNKAAEQHLRHGSRG